MKLGGTLRFVFIVKFVAVTKKRRPRGTICGSFVLLELLVLLVLLVGVAEIVLSFSSFFFFLSFFSFPFLSF